MLRGTFDLGGTNYSFLSSLRAIEPTAVHLTFPRAVQTSRRRASNRFRPRASRSISITLQSPFGGEPFTTDVLDINAWGVSFPLDYRRQVLPVGTVIHKMTLRFAGGSEVKVEGRVRNLVPFATNPDGATTTYKCGVQLTALSLQERVRIADAILHMGSPGVESASGLSFDAIWGVLQSTGFLYPEKLEKLTPVLPEIRNTISALLEKDHHLFKTVVFKRGEQIQGHLSAARIYRRTWVVQHLAAMKGGKALFAARLMNLGLSEYLEQIPEMEWLKIFFRPNNKWPARVFGTFAKRVGEPTFSDLRTFDYWSAPTAEKGRAGAGVEVRDAVTDDFAAVEAHFVERNQTVLLRANDLTRSRIPLLELRMLYEEVGLHRGRHVLVAERAGKGVGFALLEVAPLGLNLSELTNTFTLHLDQPDPDARAALIEAARAFYGKLGRPVCFALDDGSGAQALSDAGFKTTKQYTCWTWHRSLLRRYYEYVFRLYGRERTS